MKKAILALSAITVMSSTVFATEAVPDIVDTNPFGANNSDSVVSHLHDSDELPEYEQSTNLYNITYGGLDSFITGDYSMYVPLAANEIPETFIEDESKIMGTICVEGTEFYEKPMFSASIITNLCEGTRVEVISISDKWCKISYDGTEGFIYPYCIEGDFSALQQTKGIVTGASINVRTGPGMNYDIITQLPYDTVVDLLGKEKSWYHISFDGVEGYMSASYIKEYYGDMPTVIGEYVVEYAKEFMGVPYVWGGASPKCFDCSGFTMYVFKEFGYEMLHSASAQWQSSGRYVERSALQPGDLVLFADPAFCRGKSCSHVGIYIGNNEFIHASSSNGERYVRISDLSEPYYNKYYKGAKRLG